MSPTQTIHLRTLTSTSKGAEVLSGGITPVEGVLRARASTKGCVLALVEEELEGWIFFGDSSTDESRSLSSWVAEATDSMALEDTTLYDRLEPET